MIERKIIIGLITSTEYCERIKNIWNPLLLESTTAKRLAGWVWEYYEKYRKAPNKDIEGIYYQKLKESNLPKDLAEEIEQDILPGLSDEYSSKDYNVDYLVEETRKYLSGRYLLIHTTNIDALMSVGKLEEADKMARDFRPLDTSFKSISNFISSVIQIRQKDRPKPTVLIRPWLKEGQTTIIYGQYGSGKSLLSISVAYLLGLKHYDTDEAEIGEWQVKSPTGCLYIDGELGEQEMEERVSQFEWIGKQSSKYRMKIFSVPEYQLATEDSFYLSDRKNQLTIIQWLKDNPNYRLIVLDSASTLFGLIEENDNSEWSNKINPFLRDLRALGVACLLLHHSGKDNKKGLRGASAMGAMAHNIFKLSNHPDKEIDDGEAWFVLTKDKQRAAGYSFKTFAIKYTQSDNKKQTTWKLTQLRSGTD